MYAPNTMPTEATIVRHGTSAHVRRLLTPAAANTDYNGNVRVVSNAAGSPHTAALHGRGVATMVPSVVWEPLVSRMDFGQVTAGAVSVLPQLVVNHTGSSRTRAATASSRFHVVTGMPAPA